MLREKLKLDGHCNESAWFWRTWPLLSSLLRKKSICGVCSGSLFFFATICASRYRTVYSTHAFL